MKNNKKINEQLLIEIRKLNDKIAELEKSSSECKQSKKELQESEEKYRAIFEEADYGILHVDKKLKVLNVNPAFIEITGISEKTVVGRSGFDLARKFVNIKQLPRILNILKSTVSNKPVKPYELNYQDKILEVTPRKQQSGNTIGIIRDITKRKGTEEALRKSENNFQDLVENLQDGVAIIGENTNFIYGNPKFSEITGYSNDELLKMNGLAFAREEDKVKLKQRMKNRIAGKKVQSPYDRIIVRKDGTELLVEISASTTNWQGKRHPIVIIHDITERKQVENRIKESEEKLRNFVEFTPLGIWCFQPEKPVDINISEDQMIAAFFNSTCIECNDTYASMMGVSKEEILGLKLSDAMPNTDENRDYLRTFIKKGFKLSGGVSRELTKDGKEKYFSNSMVAVIKNSKLINAWGTQTDVTEHKQAEEALRESEEKFKEMANLLPQIVYEIDVNGNLTFVNEEVFESFGYSKEEYKKGFNVLQILIPEDKDRAKENIKNMLLGKDVGNNEYTVLRKDGSKISVLIYSSVIIKMNKPVGLRGLIVDITERKQAEEKLKSQNKELQMFNDIVVGRELKMIELKKEINKLLEKSGEKPKYKIIV